MRRVTRAGCLALACGLALLSGGVVPEPSARTPRAAVAPDAKKPTSKRKACNRVAARWGDDRAVGTHKRPFKTVQRLVDSLRPGQTGCLRRGAYDEKFEGWVLRANHGGRPSKPITVRSYPGERARIVGTVYIPHRSDYVTLSRLEIEGTGENTVKVYATGVVIERSEITNAGRGKSCVILGSTSGQGEAVQTVLRRNRLHDCGSSEHDNKDHAIYISSAVGVQIVGNVFWNTAGYAIHFYPNARDSRVTHNVIDGGLPSVRGGVLFGGNDDYASSGNVVERNVIAYARSSNITSGWKDSVGRGNIARHNCLWAASDANVDASDGGFEALDNIVAPPQFVDREKRDYRLRPRSRCLSVVGADAARRLGLSG